MHFPLPLQLRCWLALLFLSGLGSWQITQADTPAQPLRLGQAVENRLFQAQTHDYELSASAGEFFEIEVERQGGAVGLKLYAPNGKLVAQGDELRTVTESNWVNHRATETGIYHLEVRSLASHTTDIRYRLQLTTQRLPTTTDHPHWQAQQLVAAAEAQHYDSPATAQQTVTQLQAAIELWQAAGDSLREAITRAALGTALRDLGELSQAMAQYEKALLLLRAANKTELEMEVLVYLGYVCARQGLTLRAASYVPRLLSLSQNSTSSQARCFATVGQGALKAVAGNLPGARSLLQQSLPACQASRNPFWEQVVWILLASVQLDSGEPEQARQSFRAALQVADPDRDFLTRGYVYYRLAMSHWNVGDYQVALREGQTSLTLLERIGARDLQAEVRQFLGAMYLDLSELEQAENQFRQVTELSQGLGEPVYFPYTLGNLGEHAWRKERHAEAANWWEQAVAAHRRQGLPVSEIHARNLLARLAQWRGQTTDAMAHNQEVLRLSRTLGLEGYEMGALRDLGYLRLQTEEGDYGAEYFQRALELARTRKDRNTEIDALYGLAAIATRHDNQLEAQQRLAAALTLLESTRTNLASLETRARYLGKSQPYYEAYIETLMTQHERQPQTLQWAALALHTAERARARGLVETLTEARAEIRQGIDLKLLDQERELQQRLSVQANRLSQLGSQTRTPERAKLEAAVEALLHAQRDLQAQIRLSSPRYAALTQPQPLTLGEIQQQVLDDKTLLLEYVLGTKRSWLFAVTPTTLQVYELPPRAEIEAAVRRLRALLAQRSQPPVFSSFAKKQHWLAQQERETAAALNGLSRLLIQPAAAVLQDKRLLIVPDGVLHYVPFAALPVVSRQLSVRKRTTNNGQPLIVNHELLTLPSASMLALLRRTNAMPTIAPKTLALFADPVFDKFDERVPPTADALTVSLTTPRTASSADNVSPGRLRRLPFSRQEAHTIAALVPEPQRKLALDFAATRAAVLGDGLSSYRYVHFATHGLLNSEHPELSALALSLVNQQGTTQDGYLRTMDVFNLKLNAELVVLSGCQTALGKEVNGEGLLGLTQGFMYAGARRVVASLWQVNDEATAELMQRFYQSMLGAQKLSPARALRAAQIALRRDPRWQSPYYWAAFTLQGEW